jgi:hypothetical protein
MGEKETKTEERLEKISKNLEEINKTIKEIWSKPETKISNRDVDLQKVQILDNENQSWFNFLSAVVAGGIIGLLLFSAGVYEKNFLVGSIAFGATGIFMVWALDHMIKLQKRQLEKINKIVERIEKEESLPSLIELKKQLKDS